jgi:translation initiation factor 1 (eIF-1/SUI1)
MKTKLAIAVIKPVKTITTQEADGVALAAIQGLNQKVEDLKSENAELKDRLARLEQFLSSLASTK